MSDFMDELLQADKLVKANFETQRQLSAEWQTFLTDGSSDDKGLDEACQLFFKERPQNDIVNFTLEKVGSDMVQVAKGTKDAHKAVERVAQIIEEADLMVRNIEEIIKALSRNSLQGLLEENMKAYRHFTRAKVLVSDWHRDRNNNIRTVPTGRDLYHMIGKWVTDLLGAIFLQLQHLGEAVRMCRHGPLQKEMGSVHNVKPPDVTIEVSSPDPPKVSEDKRRVVERGTSAAPTKKQVDSSTSADLSFSPRKKFAATPQREENLNKKSLDFSMVDKQSLITPYAPHMAAPEFIPQRKRFPSRRSGFAPQQQQVIHIMESGPPPMMTSQPPPQSWRTAGLPVVHSSNRRTQDNYRVNNAIEDLRSTLDRRFNQLDNELRFLGSHQQPVGVGTMPLQQQQPIVSPPSQPSYNQYSPVRPGPTNFGLGSIPPPQPQLSIPAPVPPPTMQYQSQAIANYQPPPQQLQPSFYMSGGYPQGSNMAPQPLQAQQFGGNPSTSRYQALYDQSHDFGDRMRFGAEEIQVAYPAKPGLDNRAIDEAARKIEKRLTQFDSRLLKIDKEIENLRSVRSEKSTRSLTNHHHKPFVPPLDLSSLRIAKDRDQHSNRSPRRTKDEFCRPFMGERDRSEPAIRHPAAWPNYESRTGKDEWPSAAIHGPERLFHSAQAGSRYQGSAQLGNPFQNNRVGSGIRSRGSRLSSANYESKKNTFEISKDSKYREEFLQYAANCISSHPEVCAALADRAGLDPRFYREHVTSRDAYALLKSWERKNNGLHPDELVDSLRQLQLSRDDDYRALNANQMVAQRLVEKLRGDKKDYGHTRNFDNRFGVMTLPPVFA